MEKKVQPKPVKKQYVFATSGRHTRSHGDPVEYKKGEPVKGFSESDYKHLLVNGIIKEK